MSRGGANPVGLCDANGMTWYFCRWFAVRGEFESAACSSCTVAVVLCPSYCVRLTVSVVTRSAKRNS